MAFFLWTPLPQSAQIGDLIPTARPADLFKTLWLHYVYVQGHMSRNRPKYMRHPAPFHVVFFVHFLVGQAFGLTPTDSIPSRRSGDLQIVRPEA